MITFTRYAKRPMGRIVSRTQPGKSHGFARQYKPVGLWLTMDGDDDWYHWCLSEEFPCGPYRYQIKVHDERLLWLKSTIDIAAFTTKYNLDVSAFFHIEGKPDLNWFAYYIDWPRVADEYAGIVIVPYQWAARMNLMWYYPWDCNSACIWDASVISSIHLKRGGFSSRHARWVKTSKRLRANFKAVRSGKLFRKMENFNEKKPAADTPQEKIG